MKRKSYKYIALLLCITIIISLIGCSKNDNSKTDVEFEAYYQPITADDIAIEDDFYYVKSRILLTTVNTATYKETDSLVQKLGGEIIGYISSTNDFQIQFTGEKTYQELQDIVEELLDNPIVEDASISYVAEFENNSITYTNDPWIDANDPSDLSGLDWDEEHPGGKNWWAEAIGMPSVWDMDIDFQTVKVGIIDSMFDTTNEDLDNGIFVKLWNNPENQEGICDVSNLYQNALISLALARQNKDQGGIETANSRITNTSHGTHVAGIIAAEANNGFGITGVSQNAELYGYSVLSEEAVTSNDSNWGDIFMFKVALANLLNEGVKVINISMGFNDALTGSQDGNSNWANFTSVNSHTLETFLLKYIQAGNEFLIMKSAGNDSTKDNKYDAKNDIFGGITNEIVSKRIMIVGAAEYKSSGYYNIASFSNTGNRVDVYAPGLDILSDIPTNVTELKSGTSMATPVVTGLATLIWGINPSLSAEQVREIIIVSTSATIFSLDDRTAIVRDWINHFEDPTAIVNAQICVSLARNTIGLGNSINSEYGTLLGMVYALTPDGQWYDNFEIESLTVCDENGNRISDIPIQDIAYYYTDSNSGEDVTFSLHSYTILLEPGVYTIEAVAEGYDSKSLKATIVKGEVSTLDFEFEASEDNLFEKLPQGFDFSSGAGGWGTHIDLNPDGTFTGQYHDSDMGDTGSGYSNGTVYICDFSGRFTSPKKINDYIYSMNLESFDVEGVSGTVYYEDNIRYIVSDPYGFDNADEFFIYLPGCPLKETSEEFLSWSFINTQIRNTIPTGVYGIYNVGGMEGFMGEDENSLWRKTYAYSYNSYRSELQPSYYSESHLNFWPESGAAILSLGFDWSNDSQTEFIASDYRGTGEYNISLDFNEDFSSVMVTVKSKSGFNLEPWGGSADGTLSVEYRVK